MLTTRRLLEALKQIGITHAVGLPDNSTAALFHELADDPDIYLITVTREGEAFATAAGLWIGGQTPLVIIQNTGLLEAGDALRGTLMRMRIPVLCLVSYRGFKSLPARDVSPAGGDVLPPSRDVVPPARDVLPTSGNVAPPARDVLATRLYTADDLSRREVDSVAMLLEPTLRAWAVPYELLTENADVSKIVNAQRRAQQELRPVAVVIAETIR
jgi:hypothetical protein